MNLVLYQPEIPQNTGNIARTCAVTGANLHLIKPMGFSISSKYLKRAGLDYWHHINIKVHNCLDDFLREHGSEKLFFVSTKGEKYYTDIRYPEGGFIILGSETSGIPEKILSKFKEDVIRIPMLEGRRSLNLSSAAAVVLYESLRQNGFLNLK